MPDHEFLPVLLLSATFFFFLALSWPLLIFTAFSSLLVDGWKSFGGWVDWRTHGRQMDGMRFYILGYIMYVWVFHTGRSAAHLKRLQKKIKKKYSTYYIKDRLTIVLGIHPHHMSPHFYELSCTPPPHQYLKELKSWVNNILKT